MNSKVTEDFILLAMNPKSGNYMIFGNYLNYGILGAVMMDLALGGRVVIEGNRISADAKKGISGIHIHDRMYNQMAKASAPRRISTWLKRLSFNSRWYLIESRKSLVDRGVLRKDRRRFLFIPYNLYFHADPQRHSKLLFRLKEIILYNKTPEDHELMLLGLIYSCKLHRALSDSYDERRSIRKTLVRMMKDRPIASGIDQVIKEMQLAISAAIAAAAVATSSSH